MKAPKKTLGTYKATNKTKQDHAPDLVQQASKEWAVCAPELKIAAALVRPHDVGLSLWGGTGVPDAAAAWLRALANRAASPADPERPLETLLDEFGISIKPKKARRLALVTLTEKAAKMTAAFTAGSKSDEIQLRKSMRSADLPEAWRSLSTTLEVLQDALAFLASRQQTIRRLVQFNHGAPGMWLFISGQVRDLRIVIERARETLFVADQLSDAELPIDQRWRTRASMLLNEVESVFGPSADAPVPPGEPKAPGRRWAMFAADDAAKRASRFLEKITQMGHAYVEYLPGLTAEERAKGLWQDHAQYQPILWFNKCVQTRYPKRTLYPTQFGRGVKEGYIIVDPACGSRRKRYKVTSVCTYPPFSRYMDLFMTGLRNGTDARGRPRGRSVKGQARAASSQESKKS